MAWAKSGVLRSPLPANARFSTAASPLVIAHRGGLAMAPEHSMSAYRAAIAAGADVIEQDLQSLADGSFGVMHDNTVDRVTNKTGACNLFTAHAFEQLQFNVAAVGSGYVQGGDLRPLLWTDVLREYGNKFRLCPEVKTPGTGAAVLASLQNAGVDPDAILVQSFQESDLAPFVAAGYKTLFLGSTDYANAVAKGYYAVGPTWNNPALTSTMVASARANGVKVIPYTLARRWQRDATLALGVDGYFADDPGYLKSDAMLRKSDLFASGFLIPGMQDNGYTSGAAPSVTTGVWHSKFYTGGYWGYDIPVAGASPDGGLLAASEAFTLHGYLSPTNPSSYTLNYTLNHIGLGAGQATTRWASIFLSANDAAFLDGYSAQVADVNTNGYHLLARANGALDVYKVVNGTATNIGTLAAATANQHTAGVDKVMQIVVSPTQIVLKNVTNAVNVTVTDSTYRPLRYVTTGVAGSGWKFKGLNVT